MGDNSISREEDWPNNSSPIKRPQSQSNRSVNSEDGNMALNNFGSESLSNMRPVTAPYENNASMSSNQDDQVLPEFYTLSFMEKKFSSSSQLEAMDKTVASSPSIQLTNRSAKNRHTDVRRKRRIQPQHEKMPTLDIPAQVLRNMRISERMPYSRGHLTPSPGGQELASPKGSQPVVLRNHQFSNTGRNAGPGRPRTAQEQHDRSINQLKRTVSRTEISELYTRQTQRMVLNSRGVAIAEDCSRSSWKFRKPLDRIICTRPSTAFSSLHFALVPDCAECLLEDNSYGTVAGQAKRKIMEKTTIEDKLFLVDQRPKSIPMLEVRKPLPNQKAPFHVDYAKRGSPDRRKRSVYLKSCLA